MPDDTPRSRDSVIVALFQILLSTTFRVGANVAVFILAASQWTTEAFGLLAYNYSLGTLLILGSELGFNQQMLREIGRNPADAGRLTELFLNAKIYLSFFLAAACLVYAGLIYDEPKRSASLFISVFVGLWLASVSDLLLHALRAAGFYEAEMYVSSVANLLLFIALTATVFSGSSPEAFGLVYLCAKVFQTLSICIVTRKLLKTMLALKLAQLMKAPGFIFRGRAFALEILATTSLSSIDTLIIGRYLGLAEAGIYQAAARLSQGVGIAFSIIVSYFLPRLSSVSQTAENRKTHQAMFRSCILLSMVLMLILTGCYFYYASYPQGHTLERSSVLLLAFAALVPLRISAGAMTILATVAGKDSYRAAVMTLTLLLFIMVALFLLDSTGVWALIVATYVAYTFLCVALSFAMPAPRWRFALLGNVVLIAVAGVLVHVLTTHVAA